METKANVNDRASIEAVYPKADFDQDAHQNTRDRARVHHGLAILSAPAADGSFSIAREHRHVAETQEGSHSYFLFPLLDPAEYGTTLRSANGYDGPFKPVMPPADPEAHYHHFIEDVIETAKTAHFPPTFTAQQLKGFLGG
ncbi:hypothetical protein [Azospirillum halopraeferens]|uniref:hypothetical protein n=1 Tax=Azospirillum halopraeferens TaxID=34010 RepID=UPI000429A4AF|nr:hypothetical protein [Azospirillum halopraeferens]